MAEKKRLDREIVEQKKAELREELSWSGNPAADYVDEHGSVPDIHTLQALLDMESEIDSGFSYGQRQFPTGLVVVWTKGEARRGSLSVYEMAEDGRFDRDDAGRFLENARWRLEDFFGDQEEKFNEEFWIGAPSLYHGTQDLESVLREGIEARSESRGIGNRSVGAAVFATDVEEVAESYGSSEDGGVVRINAKAMKRDGYTPFVAQEPEVLEEELMSALAHGIGFEDYAEEYQDSGIDPATVIIHGNVPAKYLEDVTTGRSRSNPRSLRRRPNPLVEPLCSYMGAKRRYADKIVQELLALNPTRFYDLGAGSGAVTLALLRAGVEPQRITAVDAGPWGDVWSAMGRGTFDLDYLEKLLRKSQEIPPEGVKGWLENELAKGKRSPEVFTLLQCSAFGATPVWDAPEGWCRGARGEGRKFCARPLWKPKEGSVAKDVRNTLLSPAKLLRTAKAVAKAAFGIDGRRATAETVRIAPGAVVYIDPPYEGTAGYGWNMDWRSIVARHRPVVVSEGKAFPDADRLVQLQSRKGASLRGGSAKSQPEEWLNFWL